MRTYAIDSFDEIRAHAQRIKAESIPRCPVNPGRTLYACIHSPTQCPDDCPLRADWVGPSIDHNDCCF